MSPLPMQIPQLVEAGCQLLGHYDIHMEARLASPNKNHQDGLRILMDQPFSH